MVGYHNTLPFTYGLNKNKESFNVILDIPSKCISYYDSGEADVALVPVAELLNRSDFQVITDYCIGCNGEVETVCIYSDHPIRELSKIYLDSDSRTSQLLAKILVRKHWYHKVSYEEVDVKSVSKLNESEGILMIGDKAFGVDSSYKYVYDLGHEWQLMTGLPFVFALWIGRRKLTSNEVSNLNSVLSLGVVNIDAVLEHNNGLLDKVNLKDYYTQYIDFHFDSDKKKAFDLYKTLASAL